MTEAVSTIVGEEESTSQNPELQREQVETRARSKGWKPLEEWRGSPDDWVDAKEYVGRQKLFDRIDELKGEIGRQSRKFESDLGTITSHFEKMRQADYERAREELKAQLKEARRSDDPDAQEVVEAKLEKLEEDKKAADAERQQAKSAPKGPTPEFQKWQTDNTWFGENQEMTQEAIAIGTGYAALHPELPQERVLQHVSTRMKKLYPEEFEGQEELVQQTSIKRSAPSVEGGDGRRSVSTTKKGKGLTVADLSDEERQIMKVLLKRGALKAKAAKNKVSQEEQYLRDVEEYEAAANSRQARRQ